MHDILIRDERPDDEPAIRHVILAAFRDHPHSQQTEYLIVDALRRAGALSVSLVAEQAGRVAGHVVFSEVAVADGSTGWYGLGPLSVLPALQRLGIGQALVRSGLARLRQAGASGCVLVGDPSYYARFGFAHDPALSYPGIPQEYFLALPFGPARARGEVSYHPAFSVAAP